jgi:hypothetical protein
VPLEAAKKYLLSDEIADHTSDAEYVSEKLASFQSEVQKVLEGGEELVHFQTVLRVKVYYACYVCYVCVVCVVCVMCVMCVLCWCVPWCRY